MAKVRKQENREEVLMDFLDEWNLEGVYRRAKYAVGKAFPARSMTGNERFSTEVKSSLEIIFARAYKFFADRNLEFDLGSARGILEGLLNRQLGSEGTLEKIQYLVDELWGGALLFGDGKFGRSLKEQVESQVLFGAVGGLQPDQNFYRMWAEMEKEYFARRTNKLPLENDVVGEMFVRERERYKADFLRLHFVTLTPEGSVKLVLDEIRELAEEFYPDKEAMVRDGDGFVLMLGAALNSSQDHLAFLISREDVFRKYCERFALSSTEDVADMVIESVFLEISREERLRLSGEREVGQVVADDCVLPFVPFEGIAAMIGDLPN